VFAGEGGGFGAPLAVLALLGTRLGGGGGSVDEGLAVGVGGICR
jgi:hypothetical protein